MQKGAAPRLPCTRDSPPGTLESLLGCKWELCPLTVDALLGARATTSSVSLVTRLCDMGGYSSALTELVMNESLDVHWIYPGKLLCTDYTDSTLLYIAASVGTPALLEAMFTRAPDQLHVSVTEKSLLYGFVTASWSATCFEWSVCGRMVCLIPIVEPVYRVI